MIGELFRAVRARHTRGRAAARGTVAAGDVLPLPLSADEAEEPGEEYLLLAPYPVPSLPPTAVPGWAPGMVPGDTTIVDRCQGPTLDVGCGSGRLTMALAERGIPALGIDVDSSRGDRARSAGALSLVRDVFDRVPGTGRWMTVLLADGTIGIGGDPVTLLRRAGELLMAPGQVLVEVRPPGTADAALPRPWVGADQIAVVAAGAGLTVAESWSADGRWFATLLRVSAQSRTLPAPVPASPEPLFATPPQIQP